MNPDSDPIYPLKRDACYLGLVTMVVASTTATVLHFIEPNPHPISIFLPPLSALVCLAILTYLVFHPYRVHLASKLVAIWVGAITIFPEYFFVIEAFLHPEQKLIETLPPITSSLFLMITSLIIFAPPHLLIPIALSLWLIIGSPILVYLLMHPAQMQMARGLDLIITLGPAMGINLGLVLFYVRLQDTLKNIVAPDQN